MTAETAIARTNDATAIQTQGSEESIFGLLQRQAKALASSDMLPPQFKGNLPNCMIAVDIARRIGASPLMVAQNLDVIHNKPRWTSKFLIAAINSCGRYTALRYRFTGERGKPSWGCIAVTTEKATGEVIEGPEVTMEMAKAEGWSEKPGSKWKTMPQVMLQYRAASFFANLNCPELCMGIQTVEESEDIRREEPVRIGRSFTEALGSADAQIVQTVAELAAAEVEDAHFDTAE